MIHMNWQVLFPQKKKKKMKMLSAANWLGTLRVKLFKLQQVNQSKGKIFIQVQKYNPTFCINLTHL